MLKKYGILKVFAVENKRIITVAFLFGLLSIGCTVLIPLFIGEFYQLVLQTNSARGHLFESIFGHINSINYFFILFSGLLILRFVFNLLEKYYVGVSGESFSNYLRKKLFNKQIRTDLQIFEARDSGSYLLRYSGDMKATQDYLTKGVIQFLYDCIFMIAAITLLMMLEWQLTMFLVGALPMLFLINYLLNNNMRSITQKRRNLRSRNLAFVTTRLKAITTVKLFNRESVEAEKFNNRSERLYQIGKKYHFLSALMQALYPLLLYATLVLMLWFVYFQFNSTQGSLDGPALITFIMLVLSIIPVYKRILKVNMIWISGNVSFNKILVILNAKEENNNITAEESTISSGEIRFTKVNFGFNGKQIFEDLSFEIKGNSTTCITGPQGSGKSTIFKLITGLYDIESGSIYVDDLNIKNISHQQLRKNITIVSDSIPLLGSTIFEVVSYSRKEKKRKVAFEILSDLGFIKNGGTEILDHSVKEGGKNLSAGQRKLLMLARAFLTNKKILLLDEPFNDLDPEYKEKVRSLIYKMRKDHTIVIIEQNKTFSDYDQQIILHPQHV